RKYFTDVELLDQYGKSRRLYSDLMKGRVLVIDSFFSSCTGVCPVMNRQLTEIYKSFEDRMGKDLFMLSISVDPTVDTPERLKEYAANLNVGPGWYFLTGSKENVETALRKFGMYVEDRADHSNLFMIGNDAQGLWKKAFGLAPAEELVTIVDSVLNDRGGVSN
ncbi:MAG: SCO family protein, partial [Phycisphaerae bacterium]